MSHPSQPKAAWCSELVAVPRKQSYFKIATLSKLSTKANKKIQLKKYVLINILSNMY